MPSKKPSKSLSHWSVLSSPRAFFAGLKESSIAPALTWLAGGLFVWIFIGGLLSILLSTVTGVPLGKALGFIADVEPGLQSVQLYVWFLMKTFVMVYISALAVSAIGYLLSSFLGGEGGFIDMVQIVSYSLTPCFIALAIPQPILFDTTLSPIALVVMEYYNYTVNLLQVAALVWALRLAYVGVEEHEKMARAKAFEFILVPVMLIVLVIVGLFVMKIIAG